MLLPDRDPYQVATGTLDPVDITYALRGFAGRHDNVRFQRARATGMDVIMLMGGRIAGDPPEPMPPPRG